MVAVGLRSGVAMLVVLVVLVVRGDLAVSSPSQGTLRQGWPRWRTSSTAASRTPTTATTGTGGHTRRRTARRRTPWRQRTGTGRGTRP